MAKTLALDLDDELRQKLDDGAEYVAVEFHESETSASGVVVAAGTMQECDNALPFRMVVVPNGVKARAVVWSAECVREALC